MERSQVGLRVWAGLVVGMSGPGTSGQWPRTGTDIIPHPSFGNEIWSPAGTARRQNPVGLPGLCSWTSLPALGGVSRTHPLQKGNPRGCQWSSPWQKGKFFWLCGLLWLWSSWLAGVGTPISPSALGLGDGAFSAGAGVMGSFLTMSNMSRSSRSLLSSRVVRHLQSSCTAPQSMPGGIPEWKAHPSRPWPVPLFLHATPLNNLKFPGTH